MTLIACQLTLLMGRVSNLGYDFLIYIFVNKFVNDLTFLFPKFQNRWKGSGPNFVRAEIWHYVDDIHYALYLRLLYHFSNCSGRSAGPRFRSDYRYRGKMVSRSTVYHFHYCSIDDFSPLHTEGNFTNQFTPFSCEKFVILKFGTLSEIILDMVFF